MNVPLQNSFVFTLFGLELGYNAKQSVLTCLDKKTPVHGKGEFLTIRLIIDTISTEIFADDRSIFMGMTYIQDYNLNTLSVISECPIDHIGIHVAKLRKILLLRQQFFNKAPLFQHGLYNFFDDEISFFSGFHVYVSLCSRLLRFAHLFFYP